MNRTTMLSERIEKLKQEYTGQDVLIDSQRPELARFAGQSGRVKTINFNGRALVQFEGADRSWYDIELDHLKVVDRRQPEPAEQVNPKQAESPAPKKLPANNPNSPTEPQLKEKLSRLELARLEKETAHTGQTREADRGPR